MSKFLELLQSNEDIDCELIIGGCDMPATFVWNANDKITDYGIEKFKAIIEAEYTRLDNGNIEIHSEDEELGEYFCWAAAGYIGENEYDRIFGEEDEQRCRVCGCTWNNACEGGCYWVEEDLCSACVEKMKAGADNEKTIL